MATSLPSTLKMLFDRAGPVLKKYPEISPSKFGQIADLAIKAILEAVPGFEPSAGFKKAIVAKLVEKHQSIHASPEEPPEVATSFDSNLSLAEFRALIGESLLKLSPAQIAPFGFTHEQVQAYQAAA